MTDISTAAIRVLNLSYLSQKDWQSWARASGADWPLCPGDTPEALTESAMGESGRIVVLYSEPEQAVRAAIRAGEAPLAALENWLEEARALRGALRGHRRHCYLLEAGQLLEGDQESLCDALADWSGETLTPPADPAPNREALSDLLALQAVQSMPAVGRLRNELRVAGFSPDLQAERELHLAILTEAAEALQHGEARQRQAQEEGSALRAALAEANHRIETVIGEYETCAAQLDEARTQTGALEEKVIGLSAEREDLIAERRLAEQQQALAQQDVFALQMRLEDEVGTHDALQKRQAQLIEEELPSLRADLQRERRAALSSETERLRLKAQLHDCQQQRVALSEERHFLALELKRRQQDISALFDSTSWQVTAPLRALRLTLSRRNG